MGKRTKRSKEEPKTKNPRKVNKKHLFNNGTFYTNSFVNCNIPPNHRIKDSRGRGNFVPSFHYGYSSRWGRGLTLTAPMFNRYRPDNGSRYHWKQQGPSKGKQARISRGKVPSRPASPVLGSEEYMARKVKKTSEIIMRQLLNPEEQIIAKDDNQTNKSGVQSSSPQSTTGNKTNLEKSTEVINKNKKKVTHYPIEEIQSKIINHLLNLNDGRKKNLVNSSTSSYDVVIEQIQKQKRLDISQALRNMCSQTDQIQESSDLINSIIPDIGIKIEELPYELIVELNNNLNLDYEDDCPITSNSSQLCSQQHIDVSHNMEQEKDETAPNETCVKSEPIKDCNTNRLMNENAKYDNSNTLQYINVKQEYEAKSEEMSWNDETQIANILHTSDIKEETTKDGCVIKEEVVDSSIEPEISNNCTEISNNSVNISLPQTSTHCPETLDNNMFNKTIENVILNNGCIEDNVQNIYPRLEKEVLPTNYKNHEYIFINDTKVGIMENELNMLPIDNPPKPPAYIDVTTQTLENDTISPKKFAEEFVTNYFKQPPVDISEMVNRMFQIDECILHLTKYRQSLFKKLKKKNLQSDSDIISNSTNDRKLKKKKIFTTKRVLSRCKASKRKEIIIENSERKKSKPADLINELNFNKTDETHTVNKEVDLCETNTVAVKQQNLLRFEEIKEKVLVIKVVENQLLAGTESGKIFFFSLVDGHCINTIDVSEVPITTLLLNKVYEKNIELYVGSFENNLKIYNFYSQRLVKTNNIDDSIQCLESNWDYIFAGCIRGCLIRYSTKKKVIEYEDKISDNGILVLKATQEGARRVLLVGSRNSPVCIRDAMTGLYMRTMENVISPTVYSLILEKSLIYCGTTNHDILVFSFHDGKLMNKYNVGKFSGIGCLKVIKNLLFASCHNGSIYVYDMNQNVLIDSIPGPGGVILSMEVLENQVIVGTMSFNFVSIPIPLHILRYTSN